MNAYSKWFVMPSLSASSRRYAVESIQSLPPRFKTDFSEVYLPSANISI
jgi:hypothetical protein